MFLIGEREYKTEETLPLFAEKYLSSDFRCTFVFADKKDGNKFPGIEAVKDADVLFVSVRRRTLPPGDLAFIRRHVAEGKPVIGIRTASHAFSLRGKPAPKGYAGWEKWDAEVMGGNYTGHHGNKIQTKVSSLEGAGAFLAGGKPATFITSGSLYINTPLQKGAQPLFMGAAEGIERSEPVAWSYLRKGGGRSFYTSLGYVEDFEEPAFQALLVQGIKWSLAKGKAPAVGSK